MKLDPLQFPCQHARHVPFYFPSLTNQGGQCSAPHVSFYFPCSTKIKIQSCPPNQTTRMVSIGFPFDPKAQNEPRRPRRFQDFRTLDFAGLLASDSEDEPASPEARDQQAHQRKTTKSRFADVGTQHTETHTPRWRIPRRPQASRHFQLLTALDVCERGLFSNHARLRIQPVSSES